MKKYLTVFLYILLLVAIVVPPLSPARAAENWIFHDYTKGLQEGVENGSVNSPAYITHVKVADISSSQLFVGPPVEGVSVPVGAYKNDPEYVREMYNQSVIAHVNNAVIAMYANPPADFGWAMQDMGESLGLIPKKTFAQTPGIGFAGLAPILPLWKAFRNIAYTLLALVMIVVGFMVMFRKKIDPKTVVTIQSALPRVVLSLILITFSYAIVGLLIDLMYLVIYLALAIMNTTGLMPDKPRGAYGELYPTNQELYVNAGTTAIVNSIFPIGKDGENYDLGLVEVAWDLLGPKTAGAFTAIGAIVGTFVLPVIGTIIGATAGVAGPPVLLALILSLAILFTMIRLFVLFLNSYINIVLALIVGPIQLLLEAVPGANGFSSWIKNLIANLAVFPVAAIMFMIATAFNVAADAYAGNVWRAPYLSVGTSATTISALFSLGILMAIPTICASIKEALKAKSAINAGPGALFAPVTTTVGAGMGTASQFYYTGSMAKGAMDWWKNNRAKG